MSMEAAFRLAGSRLGMNEHDQNAALQEYMRNGGVNLDPAVTAWCAAFVNASLQQAGMEGTNSLGARSFMDWGVPVNDPRRGDVAVFSRPGPEGWEGHVGFFDGFGEDGRIRVLGGNQGDAVSLAYYDRDRLLGFRRADGEPANALAGGQDQRRQMQMNALAAVPQMQMLDVTRFEAPVMQAPTRRV